MYQNRQKRQTHLSLNGSHAERLKVSLYVGNLDSTVNDHDLARAFVEAGKVLGSQIIRDHDTKRSRGFGFVEMASRDDAEEAIAKLSGRILKGRAIHVALARQRKLQQITQSKSHRSKRSHTDLAKSQISVVSKEVLKKSLERKRAKARKASGQSSGHSGMKRAIPAWEPKVPKRKVPGPRISTQKDNPFGWQSDVG
jgi:RNA recognition motif-containing protein